MQPDQRKTFGKYLALVLRHAPDQGRIVLDAQGRAPLASVLAGMQVRFPGVTLQTLYDTVADDDKERYEIDRVDGVEMIWARWGHTVSTVEVDTLLPVRAPPAVLFHGARADRVERICAEGLRPMQRHHVHLSTTWDEAQRTAARYRKPVVVLTVFTGRMHAAHHVFLQAASGVWLTNRVAPEFIDVPSALFKLKQQQQALQETPIGARVVDTPTGTRAECRVAELRERSVSLQLLSDGECFFVMPRARLPRALQQVGALARVFVTRKYGHVGVTASDATEAALSAAASVG